MDKRRAIQIMTQAAKLYREHLEDQKLGILESMMGIKRCATMIGEFSDRGTIFNKNL